MTLNSILHCKNHFKRLLFFCVSELKSFWVEVAGGFFVWFFFTLDEDEAKCGGSSFDVILIALKYLSSIS